MPKKDNNTSLNKSKLIKLLAKLPPKTVKTFKAWYKQMGSPKRDAFLILEYILLYYPEFDSPHLLQNIAFTKIFGKTPYDYRKLMKGVSQVHLDLKQYLVQQELTEDDFLSDSLLARVYKKYQLRHELSLLLDKKRATKPTINSPKSYYEKLHWEQMIFLGGGKAKINHRENSLNKAMTSLDMYYLGIKLKFACDIATKQMLFGSKYEIQLSNSIKEYSKANLDKLPTFHQLYWFAWQLILHRREETYQKLKQLFWQKHTFLEKEDQLILVTYLLNYGAFKIRTNNLTFVREMFELFQFSIEKGILIINQFFIEDHFINLINISCALKEFDWLENTLENQLAPIIGDLSPSAYYLGLSRIALAKKNFIQCRSHLTNIDYNNYIYSKRARAFQLMCAVELKEPTIGIEANCKSFENYVRRNKTKQIEDNYIHLNFIRFIRHLIKINPNKEKLLRDLNSTPTIFKPWLLEKANQLQ